MSLRQIRGSYFHLTYFSFPLLFFLLLLSYKRFNFFWIFLNLNFVFSFCDPVRDPIRDPIRDLIPDPIRDPVRSDPGFVDTAVISASI